MGNEVILFENFGRHMYDKYDQIALELLDFGGGTVPSDEECEEFFNDRNIYKDSERSAIINKAQEFEAEGESSEPGEDEFYENTQVDLDLEGSDFAEPEAQPGMPSPQTSPKPSRGLDDFTLTLDDIGDFDLPDNERLPLEDETEVRGNQVQTFEQFKNNF